MVGEEENYFNISRLTRSRYSELNAGENLPSPSSVALRVMEMVQNDATCVVDIAETLQTDPALSGRIIALANSALYCPRVSVVSTKDAVATVGLRNIQQLILGISVISRHRTGGCAAFDYNLFWSRSLATAVAAEVCCDKRYKMAPAEAFTIGLVSRIGQLALVSIYPDSYAEILASGPVEPELLLEKEQQNLTINHKELSCAMLEEWGMPHDPIRSLRGLYSLVDVDLTPNKREYALAELMNYAFALSGYCVSPAAEREEVLALLQEKASTLGYNGKQLQEQLQVIEQKWREVSAILQIPPAESSGLGQADEVAPPELTRRFNESKGLRVLVAQQDKTAREYLEKVLGQAGHYVITADDGRVALRQTLEFAPQVLLVDRKLPEIDGLRLATMLRDSKYGQQMYLIVCGDELEQIGSAHALEAGADSYLSWPLSKEILQAHLLCAARVVAKYQELVDEINTMNSLALELAQSNRKMEKQSLCDTLTGLPNRRYANSRLKQCILETSRADSPLSVMMLDLDHFKSINDIHGHAVGDKVLQKAAATFIEVSRGTDEVCRIGGEEFLIICRNTDAQAAVFAGNRLCEAIAELQFGAGNEFGITVSIGISCVLDGDSDVEALMHQADEALYIAKHEGRNCVRVAGDVGAVEIVEQVVNQ